MALIAGRTNVACVLSALCREVFEIPSDWQEKRWCLHATRSGHAFWRSEVTAEEQCVSSRRREYLKLGDKNDAIDAMMDMHEKVDQLEGTVVKLEENLANAHEQLFALQRGAWIPASNPSFPSEVQQSPIWADAEQLQQADHSMVSTCGSANEFACWGALLLNCKLGPAYTRMCCNHCSWSHHQHGL